MKHLYDEPEDRSSHTTRVPTLGGVSIFAAFIITISLYAKESYVDFDLLNASMVILFFFGIKDDILMISPLKKLGAQIVSALMISIGSDVRIPQMFDILGFSEIPYWFSIVITVFVIILIINSFNLIDGVDGLAASSAIFSSAVFGIWFYMNGYFSMTMVSFTLIGSLLAFLRFNFSKKNKIFMGDTGSMIVGFIVAIQAIEFINFNSGILINGSKGLITAPVLAISILILPLLDTLRVFMIRILNRKSPFSPDRNHIHHRLEDLGLSHAKISIIMILANLVIVLLAFHMKDTGTDKFLLLMLSIASFISSIPFFIKTKRERLEANDSAIPVFKISRKDKSSSNIDDKKKVNE
ncbi:MAG: undecaprenyl/decaprenyl-phosphate alpha-N-acetylglucosaminyl 1-phosphate transferase [Flavobacteriales bacterium]|nr:undecaprenyl/decaprenyl-phosphate alpha-N-acetylglucosaminyl 1-phosphate transferase [Flavobacteriales bacterium]